MNARGISVFYGANDPVVALAEIRPPVGSQLVVGHFEIIRPLRLLDLTALGTVRTKGSIFDPTFAGRLERAMFLRKLSQRITRPVMPDDEVFDYLPTQAVADFLASNFVTPLDGIIYPSAQAAGDALNIVLFHKAARVQAINLPRGTEVSASLGHMEEDGWETEYQIIEETPPKVDANTEAQPERSWPPNLEALARFDSAREPADPDWREETLRLDRETVRVHIVQAVTFGTDSHELHRFRWEKRGLPF
jgi:hypothetical protein